MNQTINYLDESIVNFFKQHGLYPEKIILPNECYPEIKDYLSGLIHGSIDENIYEFYYYKMAKIEFGDIKDWILIAPELN